MISIVAWLGAAMTFPVEKKQKEDFPVREAPFSIRSIFPERLKY
jgi:hypothetical protein